MPLTDTKGVLWAHKDTIKIGDTVRADGGFTCIENHTRLTVMSDPGFMTGHAEQPDADSFERLYVPCGDGQHFLSGQLGVDGELVGLYSVPR